MRRTATLAFAILALGAGAHPGPCAVAMASGQPRLAGTGLRLEDTVRPEPYAPGLERAVRQFRTRPPGEKRKNGSGPAEINLVFHVLSGEAMEGNVPDSVLLAQVVVLNDAFMPTGLRFKVAGIRRYPDSAYFAGGCFPTTEQGIRMKTELAINPARFVNIYTCKLVLPLIAGYATFPNEFPDDDHQHGIVIDYGTLPGSAPPLDMGHTLVHEMGHYFGLFHTFQGGCAEPGDSVADTPAEATAAFGCQVGRDTCATPGPDPIHNYMDYSDDACTNNFTPLQTERMQASIATFRPRLIAQAFAIGPAMTGNWFDPAQSGHGFSVEVLPDGRVLADWFVFAPEGGPAWIYAVGTISGNTATLEAFQKVGAGARFPPNFDPTKVETVPWGTIVFTFTDCDSGQVSWEPVVAGYTRGSMPITRLTMPAGLSCP